MGTEATKLLGGSGSLVVGRRRHPGRYCAAYGGCRRITRARVESTMITRAVGQTAGLPCNLPCPCPAAMLNSLHSTQQQLGQLVGWEYWARSGGSVQRPSRRWCVKRAMQPALQPCCTPSTAHTGGEAAPGPLGHAGPLAAGLLGGTRFRITCVLCSCVCVCLGEHVWGGRHALLAWSRALSPYGPPTPQCFA